mgnify:CR=1 FL=1
MTLEGRGSRVAQVSRLLYKKNPMTSRADCVKSGVKRLHNDSFVTVGDAALGKPTGDVTVSVKKKQAWRYPGGIIQRAESTTINGRKGYFDHIDTTEPRRKQESNFFITINTNRRGTSTAAAPNLEQEGRVAMERALKDLAKDTMICKYLKFGPKHPTEYGNDRYQDVIQSVEWTANVEMGDELKRLHCHIWMTVHHYSQVQINMRMMQQLFKLKYHEHLGDGLTGRKHPNFTELSINGMPYIQVKLLPTANWAEVMKQYIHKGMASSNGTAVGS